MQLLKYYIFHITCIVWAQGTFSELPLAIRLYKFSMTNLPVSGQGFWENRFGYMIFFAFCLRLNPQLNPVNQPKLVNPCLMYTIIFMVNKYSSSAPMATPCSSCASLRKQKKKLQRQLKGLESKLDTNQSKWANTFKILSKKPDLVSTS